MITFGANETISSIEDRLKQIHDPSGPGELYVTSNIRDFHPGAEVALFQLLLTWATFSEDKTAVTQIAKGTDIEKSLLNLFEYDYSLAALIGATTVRGAGGINLTLQASKILQYELSKNREPFAARNRDRSASLVLAHESLAPPSYAPYLNLATSGERAPRSDAFERHIDYRLQAFYSATSSVPPLGRRTNLPSVIYELFSNAEEWGCTNLRNEPVKLPLRGILLRVHKMPSRPPAASDPLTEFIQALVPDKDCKHFLEVSIFDSGVGLAQRFLKREISQGDSINEEYGAVKACLAKHNSSSDSSSRGLGLHQVMTLTSQMRGFFRLRTGRLHLFRDFQREPYLYESTWREERIPRGKILENFQHLIDWNTASQTTVIANPYVKGAAFSLFLPTREAQPRLL